MEALIFFVLVILADVLMFATLVMSVAIGFVTMRTRAGRITFGSITTLKLWIFLLLTYLVVNGLSPDYFDDWRVGIRYFFAVYLVVQATAVMIAMNRWRRNP